MKTYPNALWVLGIFAIATWGGAAPPMLITVVNPTDFPWVEVPVILALPPGAVAMDPRGFILAGKEILPAQVDDLNGDGKPDEAAFLVSLAAGESTTYTLQPNTTDWAFPKRTHTGMYVKGFEGPGWESDRLAFRLYWDERNAIDIFGKHRPVLGLKGYATPGVNYHTDTPWGMDILKVGASLGTGGFGVWLEDKIQKVEQADREYEVIADGPLRSILDLHYRNWKVKDRRFDLRARISMIASQRWCEIELHLKPLDGGTFPEFVAALVKHPDTTLIQDAAVGVLGSWGLQALGAGQSTMSSHLGLGLVLSPETIVHLGEDADNSYARLRGKATVLEVPGSGASETVVRYRIHASWIEEVGGADSVRAYEILLRQLARISSVQKEMAFFQPVSPHQGRME